MSVTTRFAPSPTGSLHIGGARTALFNWLFARHHGGGFIIRIEDTDAERSTGESLSEIFDSLKWLGIDWDGEPLRQSARLEIYGRHAEKLLDGGFAFKCFMTPEDLEGEKNLARERGEHFRYKREWAERGKKSGAPFAVRFAVPEADGVAVSDLLHGGVYFSAADIEDFVILRADGMPTYNFASAVDDALSGVTHVIRGDEHLVNTPKQVLILKALGLPVPGFAHIPVTLAPDGSKLSKRHGAVSVSDFRKRGILPSAFANYIARLGWSHGDEEIFTMDEMVEKFDLGGLGTSPANFDEKKMLWVNGVHIRERKCEVAEPLREALSAKGFEVSAEDAEKAFLLFRERAETVVEMAEKSAFLFGDGTEFDKKAKEEFVNAETLPALEAALSAVSGMEGPFEVDGLKSAFSAVTEKTGIKLKRMAQPLRVALTGKTESPGIFEVIAALGKDKTVSRIENAVAAAGSGK